MRSRTKKIFIFALSSAAIIGIVPGIMIATINPGLVAANHLIGHRGWSAKYFQNSYAAFYNAVKKDDSKFWGAETDLQMDKDGIIWCSHYINPFEDGSLKIDELRTEQINSLYLKTYGNIDTSTLPSKAFPTGNLNPYKIDVPHDADNDQLCLFLDKDGQNQLGDPVPTSNGKGYLNAFLNNHAHPVIELKVESVLSQDVVNGCMTIDPTKVTTLINTVLDDIIVADQQTSSTQSLLSRCYFVSFFDDLLAETIKQMSENPYFNHVGHHQFQKLLDDGGVGQYVLSNNRGFTNQTPGEKSGSNTNFNNYAKYTDGSWLQLDVGRNYPIGLDVYYAFVTSQMIANAHRNGVEVNCWTADYSRTEIAEAISLDILAKHGCDYITTDEWYDLK